MMQTSNNFSLKPPFKPKVSSTLSDQALTKSVANISQLKNNDHHSETLWMNSSKDEPKINLLKLLKSSQSKLNEGKIFKPIGNQIVVPIKVSSKKMQVFPKSSQKVFNLLENCSKTKPVLHKTLDQNNENHIFAKGCSKFEEKKNSTNIPVIHFTLPKSSIKYETNIADDNDGFPMELCHTNLVGKKCCTILKDDHMKEIGEDMYDDNFADNSLKFDHTTTRTIMDTDLTSLSWLSNKNSSLLKVIRKCNPDDPIGLWSNYSNLEGNKNENSIFTALSQIYTNSLKPKQFNCESYDPLQDKPPYSFSCLIFMAIEDSDMKRLKVKGIYHWMAKHYPYFGIAPSSWKNSVRHNLSLSRCFMKADYRKNSPKNLFWCINPIYRPNLIESLKRSYHLHPHSTNIKEPKILLNLLNLPLGSGWQPLLDSSPPRLNPDPDITDAALNLIGLSVKGLNLKPDSKVESINNTLEEIFRDVYFQNRCSHSSDNGEYFKEELIIVRDQPDDHNYCCAFKKAKNVKKKTNCSSPSSEKSGPDAAYEFEITEISEDDLNLNVVQDIMEEIMIGSDVEEKENLFDSGFGSLYEYKVSDLTKSECTRRGRKAKSYSYKGYRQRKPGSCKSIQKGKKLKVKKCIKQRKEKLKKFLPSNKHPTAVFKRNAKCSKKKRKNSSSDSGKDSPVKTKLHDQKYSKSTTYRSDFNSNYNKENDDKGLVNHRKKKISFKSRRSSALHRSANPSDEEDEVKRAAGSLMRLAGLIKTSS